MTRFNAASKERARRARAIAIDFNQGVEQQTFRSRKVMILLAIVMLDAAMATHAFAAGRIGTHSERTPPCACARVPACPRAREIIEEFRPGSVTLPARLTMSRSLVIIDLGAGLDRAA